MRTGDDVRDSTPTTSASFGHESAQSCARTRPGRPAARRTSNCRAASGSTRVARDARHVGAARQRAGLRSAGHEIRPAAAPGRPAGRRPACRPARSSCCWNRSPAKGPCSERRCSKSDRRTSVTIPELAKTELRPDGDMPLTTDSPPPRHGRHDKTCPDTCRTSRRPVRRPGSTNEYEAAGRYSPRSGRWYCAAVDQLLRMFGPDAHRERFRLDLVLPGGRRIS